MRMAHGGDDALTQAPKVHDLRDYDVEVRHSWGGEKTDGPFFP